MATSSPKRKPSSPAKKLSTPRFPSPFSATDAPRFSSSVSAAWANRRSLDWLREVDAVLKTADCRLLLALDEVERLEDGISEGWATTDLLDLIRAAGDVLERIRFLLATAYPLPRLGPYWVDRLINVLPRQLGPLAPKDAGSLIREPMPGFPDIYPEGGVDRPSAHRDAALRRTLASADDGRTLGPAPAGGRRRGGRRPAHRRPGA